jgi:TrmH family RNA methyltransferase
MVGGWDRHQPPTTNSVKTITSRHNPIVGRFRSMADAPDPGGAHLLLDGAHLVRDAHNSGLAFEIVAVASSSLRSGSEEGRLATTLAHAGIDVIETADEVFHALSPVKTPSGIAAIVARRPIDAADVCAPDRAFILMVVDVQEPGNVGALLRAAEAGGVTGAFVCGSSAHPFSWKAVRGSMGSALRLPVVAGMSTETALAHLQDAGVRAIAAIPRGGEDPDTVDWHGKIALVMGGEGEGLDIGVLSQCDTTVSIPMASTVDSLNVATAAAVLVYAARRARRS